MPIKKSKRISEEAGEKSSKEENLHKADSEPASSGEKLPSPADYEIPDKLIGDDLEIEQAKNTNHKNGSKGTY